MKASWIEDSLGFIAPIAFLIAARLVYRQPTPRHPYGFHRSFGIGHLVAAVALLTFGGYLLVDSAMGLLTGEHPPMGKIGRASCRERADDAEVGVLVKVQTVLQSEQKTTT